MHLEAMYHLGYSKEIVYEGEQVEVGLCRIKVSNKRVMTLMDSPVLSLLLPRKGL